MSIWCLRSSQDSHAPQEGEQQRAAEAAAACQERLAQLERAPASAPPDSTPADLYGVPWPVVTLLVLHGGRRVRSVPSQQPRTCSWSCKICSLFMCLLMHQGKRVLRSNQQLLAKLKQHTCSLYWAPLFG